MPWELNPEFTMASRFHYPLSLQDRHVLLV